MTKSISGKKIISKIPRNFILTETDGPFISENHLPIRPGQVQAVITFLATEWNINEGYVAQTVVSNFNSLLAQIK
jgi:TatD DNase family protein